MKYPAAGYGVSIGIHSIAPRGGELNLHPPPADLNTAEIDFSHSDNPSKERNFIAFKKRAIAMKSSNLYLSTFAILVIAMGSFVFAAEEASSIMCDNGVVNVGDRDVSVQETCGEPNTKGMNQWVYNFGPSQPVYTLIFKDGQLIKILEDEWGS